MRLPAKRRFGQHFLRDAGIIDRLARLISPRKTDALLEIGAGEGALSARLAAEAGTLLAVEVDSDRIKALEGALHRYPWASVIHEDILRLDIRELAHSHSPPIERLRVVGNLPYNIATVIIERLLLLEPLITDMVFMVQLEVAQRIVSVHGCKQYGYLSVMCRHRADACIHFKVPPQCFVPRPKVMSAVISLQPKGVPWEPALESCFTEITKASFAHRRKTLLNSLRLSLDPGTAVIPLLGSAGIQPGTRAEDLTVEEYERLSLQLYRTRARA